MTAGDCRLAMAGTRPGDKPTLVRPSAWRRNEAEFAALGVPFRERGARNNEYLRLWPMCCCNSDLAPRCEEAALRISAPGDTVRSLPASGALKPMPEAQIAQSVQLLDLMLEHFADDGHWTRGRYDDGNGGHCLVGALLHLSREHRLPRAPAIALLQDAMPRPGLPLVHFNDTLLRQRRRAALHHPEGPPPRR